MMIRLQHRKAKNNFLSIAAILFCVAIHVYSCQNKKATKAMNEENKNKQSVETGRLLSVANLEQTDSGRQVIAWFFETPQVFEFSIGTEQSQHFFKILKDAKEKQMPVNVLSIVKGDKNIIVMITSATEDQINRYNQERGKRQQPVIVPPPAHN
jgi:hypothetical protein